MSCQGRPSLSSVDSWARGSLVSLSPCVSVWKENINYSSKLTWHNIKTTRLSFPTFIKYLSNIYQIFIKYLSNIYQIFIKVNWENNSAESKPGPLQVGQWRQTGHLLVQERSDNSADRECWWVLLLAPSSQREKLISFPSAFYHNRTELFISAFQPLDNGEIILQ